MAWALVRVFAHRRAVRLSTYDEEMESVLAWPSGLYVCAELRELKVVALWWTRGV